MDTDDSTVKSLLERYFKAWNDGDLDAFDVLLSPDYVNHSPGAPDPSPGPAGLKPIVVALRTGFPDLRYQLQHLIVEGDLAAAHTVVTGTNTGPLFGAAPTGRSIRVRQMQIERIRDGRIAEHWRVTDETLQAAQLAGHVDASSPGHSTS